MQIRRTLTATFAAVLILVCMGGVNAEELIVEFADSAWDGVTIPKGQHCKKFGGDGSTPLKFRPRPMQSSFNESYEFN